MAAIRHVNPDMILPGAKFEVDGVICTVQENNTIKCETLNINGLQVVEVPLKFAITIDANEINGLKEVTIMSPPAPSVPPMPSMPPALFAELASPTPPALPAELAPPTPLISLPSYTSRDACRHKTGRPFCSIEACYPDVYELLVRIGVRGELFYDGMSVVQTFLKWFKGITPSPRMYETSNGVYWITEYNSGDCVFDTMMRCYHLEWKSFLKREKYGAWPKTDNDTCVVVVNGGETNLSSFMRKKSVEYCKSYIPITCYKFDVDDPVVIILTWITGECLDEMSFFNVCKTMQYHINYPGAKPITTEDGRHIYRYVKSKRGSGSRRGVFVDCERADCIHDVRISDIYYHDGKVICSWQRVFTYFESV